MNSSLVIPKMIFSPIPQISDLDRIFECIKPKLTSIDSNSLVSGCLCNLLTLPILWLSISTTGTPVLTGGLLKSKRSSENLSM